MAKHEKYRDHTRRCAQIEDIKEEVAVHLTSAVLIDDHVKPEAEINFVAVEYSKEFNCGYRELKKYDVAPFQRWLAEQLRGVQSQYGNFVAVGRITFELELMILPESGVVATYYPVGRLVVGGPPERALVEGVCPAGDCPASIAEYLVRVQTPDPDQILDRISAEVFNPNIIIRYMSNSLGLLPIYWLHATVKARQDYELWRTRSGKGDHILVFGVPPENEVLWLSRGDFLTRFYDGLDLT